MCVLNIEVITVEFLVTQVSDGPVLCQTKWIVPHPRGAPGDGQDWENGRDDTTVLTLNQSCVVPL